MSTPQQQLSRQEDQHTTETPEDATILLPMRDTVIYPELVMPIVVGRQPSVAAAQAAARAERPIGLVRQQTAETEAPGARDLDSVGTLANVLLMWWATINSTI